MFYIDSLLFEFSVNLQMILGRLWLASFLLYISQDLFKPSKKFLLFIFFLQINTLRFSPTTVSYLS